MSTRFTVLHHTGLAQPHFDLLLEAAPDQLLLAFRLMQWPAVAERVERLADHRRIYLDYEGPISGGRGSVRRVCTGQCVIREKTERAIVVDLDDEKKGMTLELRLLGGAVWEMVLG